MCRSGFLRAWPRRPAAFEAGKQNGRALARPFYSGRILLVRRMRAGRLSVIVALDRMIHALVARPTAAMPAPPPVQRKPIRPVIAVRTVLPMRAIAAVVAVLAVLWLAVLRLLMLWLIAGDE